MKLYEKFEGEDLKIAEKIQQRRRQMLLHSYLYYILDSNVVSDYQWAEWGKELQRLQEAHPEIAKEVEYAEEFKDWDASSGAHLPLDEPWLKSACFVLYSM